MNDKKETTEKSNNSKNDAQVSKDRNKRVDDQGVCVKAPEWAEHQRLWDDDMPCDDGRSGNIEDE